MAQPKSSPSPSPPPQPPTAQTPGRRAAAFIKLYEGALDKTLMSMTYESFADCFPTIAENAGDALRALHGDMVVKLGVLARNEFDKILQERTVITHLNALEDLIADARKRQSRSTSLSNAPTPPHTLPPSDILSAHLTPILISQNSQLNAKIQTTASQNASLIEEIKRQREEIEELLSQVEGKVGDLESAGNLLAGDMGEKSGKAREAEEVLMGMES